MAMKWEASSFGIGDPFGDSGSTKPLMCNFCGFVSGSSLEYQNHTLTHMSSGSSKDGGKSKKNSGVEKKPKLEEKPHPCKSCYVMCTSAAALKKHVKESHPEVEPSLKRPRTKLDVMRGITSSDVLAEKKPRKIVKKEGVKCPSCDVLVGSQKDLKLHECEAPSSWKPFDSIGFNPFFPFRCKLCEYSASTQMDLDGHVQGHGSFPSFGVNQGIFDKGSVGGDAVKAGGAVEEKSFKCPFNCGYTGARDDLLKAHLERKHGAQSSSKSSKMKDDPAPKQLVPASSVAKITKPSKPEKQIIKAVAQVEEKTFQCGMCDYAGTKKENLKGHMQRIHGATDSKSKKKGEEKTAGTTLVTLSGANGIVQVKVGHGGKPKKKQ